MNENTESKLPKAENPDALQKLRLSKPESIAAGMEAVYAAAKDIFKEANVVRGMKALLKLNQKGGYDCPSCAWPDPDDDRSCCGIL